MVPEEQQTRQDNIDNVVRAVERALEATLPPPQAVKLVRALLCARSRAVSRPARTSPGGLWWAWRPWRPRSRASKPGRPSTEPPRRSPTPSWMCSRRAVRLMCSRVDGAHRGTLDPCREEGVGAAPSMLSLDSRDFLAAPPAVAEDLRKGSMADRTMQILLLLPFEFS